MRLCDDLRPRERVYGSVTARVSAAPMPPRGAIQRLCERPCHALCSNGVMMSINDDRTERDVSTSLARNVGGWVERCWPHSGLAGVMRPAVWQENGGNNMWADNPIVLYLVKYLWVPPLLICIFYHRNLATKTGALFRATGMYCKYLLRWN